MFIIISKESNPTLINFWAKKLTLIQRQFILNPVIKQLITDIIRRCNFLQIVHIVNACYTSEMICALLLLLSLSSS